MASSSSSDDDDTPPFPVGTLYVDVIDAYIEMCRVYLEKNAGLDERDFCGMTSDEIMATAHEFFFNELVQTFAESSNDCVQEFPSLGYVVIGDMNTSDDVSVDICGNPTNDYGAEQVSHGTELQGTYVEIPDFTEPPKMFDENSFSLFTKIDDIIYLNGSLPFYVGACS